jgi:hypothetical protein
MSEDETFTRESEMVLRVANALFVDMCRQRGQQPGEWERQDPNLQDLYLLQAAAAIRAMEEPTQSMLDHRMAFETNENARRVWKAQIKAALHFLPWAGG